MFPLTEIRAIETCSKLRRKLREKFVYSALYRYNCTYIQRIKCVCVCACVRGWFFFLGGGLLWELVAGEHFGQKELRTIMNSSTLLVSVPFFELLNWINDLKRHRYERYGTGSYPNILRSFFAISNANMSGRISHVGPPLVPLNLKDTTLSTAARLAKLVIFIFNSCYGTTQTNFRARRYFILQSDADNRRTTVPWDTEFCITTANYVLNTVCKTMIYKMAALTRVQY